VAAHPWLPALWVREVLCEGGALRGVILEKFASQVPQALAAKFAQAQRDGMLNPDLDPRLLVVSMMGLTLFPAATYADAEVPFHAGDRLLLFTDGLLEATRRDGDEFFGDSELARVAAGVPESEDVAQAVLRAHREWIGEGTPLSDDVTLVVVECVPVA